MYRSRMYVNSARRASVNDLYLGLYTVKEETPGHLYMLDETEYTVDLGSM